MNDWNIQSRSHACTACEKPFTDKQSYHTVLFDDHAEFHRHDLCEDCWQKDFGPDARETKGFISHWQGTYEAPPPPEEVVPKENAESLLRKIIEVNDPQYIPAAYILAVMLERKRLLKVKEQLNREGHRVFIYEQPKTGDAFTIIDPGLQLNQLDTVQRDVAQLLEHGFNPPAEAATSDEVPSEPTAPAGSAAAVSEEEQTADETKSA